MQYPLEMEKLEDLKQVEEEEDPLVELFVVLFCVASAPKQAQSAGEILVGRIVRTAVLLASMGGMR